jgi:hypothetical protein
MYHPGGASIAWVGTIWRPGGRMRQASPGRPIKEAPGRFEGVGGAICWRVNNVISPSIYGKFQKESHAGV